MKANIAACILIASILLSGSLGACRRIRPPVTPEKQAKKETTSRRATTTASRPAQVYVSYKIKRGDTLGKIAKKFGCSPWAIEKANPNPKLDERNLEVGRVIKVPQKKRPTPVRAEQ